MRTQTPSAASANSPSTADTKKDAPPQSYAQRAKIDPQGLFRDLIFDGSSVEDALLVARYEPEDAAWLQPLIHQTQAERRLMLRKALTAAALAGKTSVLLYLAKQELKAQKETILDEYGAGEPHYKPSHPRTDHEKALAYARYIGAPMPDDRGATHTLPNPHHKCQTHTCQQHPRPHAPTRIQTVRQDQ